MNNAVPKCFHDNNMFEMRFQYFWNPRNADYKAIFAQSSAKINTFDTDAFDKHE